MVTYVIATLLRPYEREGGWSGPRNYATGNNLYKAETDPENFARGGGPR